MKETKEPRCHKCGCIMKNIPNQSEMYHSHRCPMCGNVKLTEKPKKK
jgi:predicted RNA-binding Zn-ribbon protein involved in translation (DUF1610 family)